MHKICPTCKTVFYKKVSDSRKYWKKKKYCSIPCSQTTFSKGHTPANKGKEGLKGKSNPYYKGGRNIAKNGYVRVLIIGTGRYAFEHRVVMEKYLGRKLKRNEHVHHKNGDKTDNRIENLELMGIRDHNHKHTTERWNDPNKPFRSNLK